MFDRGLIGLSDELDIMVSRQVNDLTSITAMINPTRKALVPGREAERPHPQFLAWHREHCFKHRAFCFAPSNAGHDASASFGWRFAPSPPLAPIPLA